MCFHVFIGYLYSFSEKYLFISVAHVLNKPFIWGKLTVLSSLYILDTSPLSEEELAKFFPILVVALPLSNAVLEGLFLECL